VRDIAADQGKLARVVIEGEDVEVDASIVEQLRDKAAGGQTPQMVVPSLLGDVALVGADR